MLPYIPFGPIEFASNTFFWVIGIICSEIYYFFVAKKFSYGIIRRLIYGVLILVFEVIGAKILFFLENISTLSFPGSLKLTGGFSLFGVFFFLPLLAIPLCIIAKDDYFKFMDFASIGILIELAWYRVGCFCVGCCGGIEMFGSFVFPTQLVELICDAIIAAVLIVILFKNKNANSGFIAGLTFISYGLLRFIIEFFRERVNIVGPFAFAHIWALLTVIIGVGFLFKEEIKTNFNKAKQ